MDKILTEEQIEIFQAVEKINVEIENKYLRKNNLEHRPILSVTIADNYTFVSMSIPDEFSGQELIILNSENNDRIYYEKSNTQETFYKMIKRRFYETKELISSVKL